MKKIFVIVFILLFAGSAFAQDAKLYKLKNGQTVIIQEVKNNPIVIIDTWIKTGSIDEDDTNNGVAHFLEHLFFKGTKNHPAGEFDRILETKGALTNAATSKDFTHYYITIPSKDFDLALELHADMLSNPAIPTEEMEQERKVVIEEINKDLKSPTRLLHDNLYSMMFTNHPYKRKVIGKSEIIENISRESILDFYNKHYSPANMVTIIIGDVNSDYALERVKEVFNSKPQKQTKTIYPKESILTAQKKKVDYQPVQTGYMIIGFRSTPINDNDAYALDILATILGEGYSSVLNQSIKEKQQLAYTIDAGNSTFRDDGVFYVSATFDPKNLKRLQDEIFNEINNIQQNGVTDEQLSLAKNIIERNTYYSRESITNIATEIGYTTALTNDLKFYETYLDRIKGLSKDAVKRVANKYLGIEKSAVSILLPEDAKNIPISNTITTKPATTAKLVSKSNETFKYELSNGATILYTPNKVNDIVAISIHAKGGQLAQDVSASAKLTASTMLKGTQKYSVNELARILEDEGIKIAPALSADSFAITVLTTKPQLEKTLCLLDEVVNHATFPENEINKAKTDILNSIKSKKDLPLQRAIEQYREMIYPSGQYSISANILEKNIEKVTKENILNYYNKIFAPQNLVISINGNVDPEFMMKRLGEIFDQRCIQDKFKYEEYSNTIGTITEPKTNTINMNTETAWILLGWQVSGVKEEKDFATLQIIDTLLGSGMSSRMFKDLREKQGLAYQLGSGYSANVLRGSFMLYIGTNPANLEKSKAGLFDEINRLKTTLVEEKELYDAKEKLLGNYILSLETNLEKAKNIGWYESSERGYEFKDKYTELINSVSAQDIINVANKYFTQNYVMSVVTKE